MIRITENLSHSDDNFFAPQKIFTLSYKKFSDKLQKISENLEKNTKKKLTQSDDNYFSFGIKYLRTPINISWAHYKKSAKNRKKLEKKTTENLARKLKNLLRDEGAHKGDNSPNR